MLRDTLNCTIQCYGETMEIEIKIVQTREDRKKEIRAISKQIMKGIIDTKKTIILTPELFAKIFSPKRLDVLMTLTHKEANNITDLARKLRRKFEVVYRDLKLFEHFGFVKLVKENKSIIPELVGEIKMPVIA